MSTRMTFVRAHVRWRYRARHDLVRMRQLLPARQVAAPVPSAVEQLCDVRRELVGGRPMVTLTPRAPVTGVHVIHLHGGAYVYSVQERHWTTLARLVDESGATIHVPQYALAPAATVDDAYALLDAVIDRVRETTEDSPLFLSGDSAGGGLALGQALRMRDRGVASASGLLLFSPWVDITMTNHEIAPLERLDPMLSRRMLAETGRWWAGGHDPADPLVSPVLGELRGLPPVATYIGGRDILLADARKLDALLHEAGVESDLRVWQSGFHVFMAASSTKEAREVMADAALRLRLAAW